MKSAELPKSRRGNSPSRIPVPPAAEETVALRGRLRLLVLFWAEGGMEDGTVEYDELLGMSA